MSDSVIHLTKDTFESEVTRSDKPVLVDFWASWCGPCRMLAPIIDEIAGESPAFKVCKVNVDDEPDLATQFGVMSIPTLIAFRDGKASSQRVGFCSKSEVLAMMGQNQS